MCPQLISSKNNKNGYDAIKADIWACGVLLFVMLLGMFPYGTLPFIVFLCCFCDVFACVTVCIPVSVSVDCFHRVHLRCFRWNIL